MIFLRWRWTGRIVDTVVACLSFFLLLAGSSPLVAQTVQLVNAFPSLSFRQPVFLTHSGDGSNRIFVVQQNGLIEVFANDSTASTSTTFLDVSAKISSSDGEEGLLGLAFDPQFAQNGYFYIDYTAPKPLHTVVSRFHISANDPNKADSLSEFVLLTQNQPYTNHNGGMVVFGPDGYLYIGYGDGGSGGDPQGNGQNRATLLGKILRIDVRDTTATEHYRIPSDNPYAGNSYGYKEEIWAYGLRNPWRFSFDPPTGQLWAGDVGQDSREEVDIIEKGGDYGWNVMEGTACYSPSSGCNTTGLILPVKDYDHSLGDAVTGGYVYRGDRRPDLDGAYIYADFGSGRIWMLRDEGGHLSADAQLLDSPYGISAFGVDQQNELYILSYSTGGNTSIFHFARVPLAVKENSDGNTVPRGNVLDPNYPNPFNPSTTIRYQLSSPSNVRLTIYDDLGREVGVLAQGAQSAGRYVVQWDASHFASGRYQYRLKAEDLEGKGTFVQTRAMVLIK